MGVVMRHRTTGAVIETVDINDDDGEAQANVNEANGWDRIEAAALSASEIFDRPIRSIAELTDDELHEVAVRNQVDLTSTEADGQVDIAARLSAHFGEEPLSPIEPVPAAVENDDTVDDENEE